jgi:hypothetical protein
MRALFLLVTPLALGLALLVAPPRAEAAADQLFATQSCEAGTVRIVFNWTGGNPAAVEQWLDLTVFNNGWLDGTFLSAGPMQGGVAEYAWQGIAQNTQHYVRVNQQLGNGTWDPSPTFPVKTILCGTAAAPAPPGGGGVSLTLLGFSTSYSGGSPPADLIVPGSTRLACNPLNIYAFVQVNALNQDTQFYPWWLTNASPVNKAPFTVLANAPMFVVTYPIDTLTSVAARYTLRLSTSFNGPPVLEGGFTLTC